MGLGCHFIHQKHDFPLAILAAMAGWRLLLSPDTQSHTLQGACVGHSVTISKDLEEDL